MIQFLLRWESDDPEVYIKPVDLFEEQEKEDLSIVSGKKDRKTTLQTIFTCNLCQCDIKSIKTLRLVGSLCWMIITK